MDRVTEALADATGRSDDEVRAALTLAAVLAALLAALRVLRLLDDLGFDVSPRGR
ncbi:hypothetical protein JCM18899A_29170 [Nocardioides sp. AN3]